MAKRAASSKPTRPARKKPGVADSRGGRSGTHDRPTRSRRPPKTEAEHLETVGEFVTRKAWDERGFGGVLAYLAGLMDQPEILLNELSGGEDAKGKPTQLNKFGDDELRHRLRGAALCLNEMPASRRNRPGVVAWMERAGGTLVELQIKSKPRGWKIDIGQPAINAIVHAQSSTNATVIDALRAAARERAAWQVACDAIETLGDAAAQAQQETLSGLLVDLRLALREHDEEFARRDAASALATAFAHAPHVIREQICRDLRAALRHDVHPGVRRAAAEALRQIAGCAPPSMLSQMFADLCTALREDEDEGVRNDAAWVLGDTGAQVPDGQSSHVVSELCSALCQDREDWVRETTAEALGKVAVHVEACDRKKVMDSLRAAMQGDRDGDVRRAAADALGESVVSESEVKSKGAQAFAQLRSVFGEDMEESARYSLTWLLYEQDTAASNAEPSGFITWLRAALRDDDHQCDREFAIEALGQAVGHASPQVRSQILDDLRTSLNDDRDLWIRVRAAKELGKAKVPFSPDALQRTLKDLCLALPQYSVWHQSDTVIDALTELNARWRFRSPGWCRVWTELARGAPKRRMGTSARSSSKS